MAEKIAFENERISNFEGLLTLTLDRVILHAAVHQSLTFIYMPNLIDIKGTFCRQTDGHLRPTLLGQLRRADLTINSAHLGSCDRRQQKGNKVPSIMRSTMN